MGNSLPKVLAFPSIARHFRNTVQENHPVPAKPGHPSYPYGQEGKIPNGFVPNSEASLSVHFGQEGKSSYRGNEDQKNFGWLTACEKSDRYPLLLEQRERKAGWFVQRELIFWLLFDQTKSSNRIQIKSGKKNENENGKENE